MLDMKILIVDDSAIIRTLMCRCLARLGKDILQAVDGKQGWEIITTNYKELGVIILDEDMPYMKGSQICSRMRLDDRLKQIPVISVTSHSNKSDIISIFKSGANDYVKKPFIEEELLARVLNHLERHNNLLELEDKIQERTKELETARNEAQAASTLKSRFVANMSHEIRTPLNGIIGFTNILLENVKDDVDSEYLNLIKTSADSLLELVNNALDFSKIEAGKLEINKEVFNLKNILESVYRFFNAQANFKNVEVVLSINDAIPNRLIGDPLRLQQILVNLLGNSLKFTSSRGGILIMVRIAESSHSKIKIEFSISDSGIGMDQSSVESIFLPFHQADLTTTRKFGGTGLGLSITLQFIKHMQGDIKVLTKKGIGSTFIVTIPYDIPAEASITNNNKDVALDVNEKSSSLTILVAEDHPVNQKLIQTILSKKGHIVKVVSDGQQALEAVRNYQFDIILMDCQMPVMDGYESTRKIREWQAGSIKSIPILAVSANAMKGDLEKCQQAGMDGLVSKPISTTELFNAIESLLT